VNFNNQKESELIRDMIDNFQNDNLTQEEIITYLQDFIDVMSQHSKIISEIASEQLQKYALNNFICPDCNILLKESSWEENYNNISFAICPDCGEEYEV
jgi:acetone carboxylase gamma subunit